MPDEMDGHVAPDVLAIGELLVDMIANKSGPLAESPTFTRAPGGSAAAVAAGVARLGRRAAFAGLVGDDPFGRYLARTLASYGVDTSYLRFDTRARTPVAFFTRDDADDEYGEAEQPRGESDGHEFLFYREAGADQLLAPSAVPLDALTRSRMLLVGGLSLSNPLPRAAVQTAIRHARAAGVTVVFDANWRPRLWPNPGRARELYREILPQADILKLSATELIMLTRGAASTEVRRQEALLQAWLERLVAGRDRPLLVALTRGAAGCSFALWKPGARLQVGHLPAYEVDVKDRAGAGDAFLAALLVAILDHLAPVGTRTRAKVLAWQRDGHAPDAEIPAADASPAVNSAPSAPLDLARFERDELEEIFEWANTAGALATAHRGTMSALPSRATILRILRGHNIN